MSKFGGVYFGRSSDLYGHLAYDVYINGSRDKKITDRKGYLKILPIGRYTIQTRRAFLLSYRESNSLIVDVTEENITYVDVRTRFLAFSKESVLLRKSYTLPVQLVTSQSLQSLKDDVTFNLPHPIDLRNFLALALTPLFSAITLSFFPQLHPNPTVIGVILTVIGCLFLGYTIHKVTSTEIYPVNQDKTNHPYKHFALSSLFFTSFLVLQSVMPYQVRGILFAVLMYATGELLLGVGHTISKVFINSSSPTNTSSPSVETKSPEASSSIANTNLTVFNWPVFTRIAVVIAGITAFFASLLQILQILQFIP